MVHVKHIDNVSRETYNKNSGGHICKPWKGCAVGALTTPRKYGGDYGY